MGLAFRRVRLRFFAFVVCSIGSPPASTVAVVAVDVVVASVIPFAAFVSRSALQNLMSLIAGWRDAMSVKNDHMTARIGKISRRLRCRG